jgi:general secretion pathway protein A
MYREYFGLKENPFSIAPDPHYFFMSEGHREALAHLVYGINSDGGFILLTGEVGTGKTMVCRCLLNQMPDNADIAFILNPRLTVEELLATICDEFGIPYPEGTTSNKVFISGIYNYLLETMGKDRRAILIVEEAQNLSVEVLEQIRLLTNLETSERKLLQIIMLGQPELREMLARHDLRQLSQRITARYHLGPLSKKEVPLYVRHRLEVSGLTRGRPFPDPVLARMHRLTGGVPRLINLICDRALTGAFAQDKDAVDKKTLLKAAREVSGEDRSWGFAIPVYGKLAGVFLLLLLCAAVAFYYVRAPGHVERSAERSAVLKAITPETHAVEPVAGRTIDAKAVTLEKPEGATSTDMRDMAHQALFKLWQITYDPGDLRPPCEQAARQGLQCLEDGGTLNALKRLNRPALIRLRDGKKGEYDALITSLRGETATLIVGGVSRSIDVRELWAKWSGDYLLLWRSPPGYKGGLLRGSRGPAVAWLDGQLALREGRAANSARQMVYDEEMEKRVRSFQTASGLTPDGVVGSKTAIYLTDGTGGPSLGVGKGE